MLTFEDFFWQKACEESEVAGKSSSFQDGIDLGGFFNANNTVL